MARLRVLLRGGRCRGRCGRGWWWCGRRPGESRQRGQGLEGAVGGGAVEVGDDGAGGAIGVEGRAEKAAVGEGEGGGFADEGLLVGAGEDGAGGGEVGEGELLAAGGEEIGAGAEAVTRPRRAAPAGRKELVISRPLSWTVRRAGIGGFDADEERRRRRCGLARRRG
jgi:hypothetical protein